MSRFPVLNTISVVLKVLAVVTLFIGFFGGLSRGGGLLVVSWIGAFISAVALYAYAEIIAVVLAIEENTRGTHEAMARSSTSSSTGSRPSWMGESGRAGDR